MKYKERFFDIQKCSEREQLMYEVYYLYKVEHEKVTSRIQLASANLQDLFVKALIRS